MRTSSRFAWTVWHATQVRCGRGRRPTAAVPFGLTAFLLLLGSEERSVLFIKLLFVRHGRLGLDLGDEIVARFGVFLDDRGRFHDGRDRLWLGLWLELGTDLRLAADVDPPASELRRQPRVLTFLADRERKLSVGYDDVGRLVIRDDVDADDVRRLEG